MVLFYTHGFLSEVVSFIRLEDLIRITDKEFHAVSSSDSRRSNERERPPLIIYEDHLIATSRLVVDSC